MRIQLEVPPAMEVRLKQWMKDAGFRTYSELFNNGFSLLVWIGNEVKNGRIILSVDPEHRGVDKQLSMPFMDVLSPASANEKAATEHVAYASSTP